VAEKSEQLGRRWLKRLRKGEYTLAAGVEPAMPPDATQRAIVEYVIALPEGTTATYADVVRVSGGKPTSTIYRALRDLAGPFESQPPLYMSPHPRPSGLLVWKARIPLRSGKTFYRLLNPDYERAVVLMVSLIKALVAAGRVARGSPPAKLFLHRKIAAAELDYGRQVVNAVRGGGRQSVDAPPCMLWKRGPELIDGVWKPSQRVLWANIYCRYRRGEKKKRLVICLNTSDPKEAEARLRRHVLKAIADGKISPKSKAAKIYGSAIKAKRPGPGVTAHPAGTAKPKETARAAAIQLGIEPFIQKGFLNRELYESHRADRERRRKPGKKPTWRGGPEGILLVLQVYDERSRTPNIEAAVTLVWESHPELWQCVCANPADLRRRFHEAEPYCRPLCAELIIPHKARRRKNFPEQAHVRN